MNKKTRDYARLITFAITVLLIIVAVFFRISAFHQLERTPFGGKLASGGDSEYYVAWAERIIEGDDPVRGAFFMSPLYPYFLACMFLVAGKKFLVIYVLQYCLGLVTCFFCYRIGAILVSKETGYLAAALFILSPVPLFFEGTLLMASLLLFLYTGALWSALEAVYRQSLWFALGSGLMIGLGSIGRGNILLCAPLFAILFLWRLRHKLAPRRIVILLLVFFVAVSAVIIPVATRNYLKERHLTLITSNLGLNFYIGNNAKSHGMYELMDEIRFIPGELDEDIEGRRFAEKETGRTLTSAEVSQFWLRKGITWWKESPSSASVNYLRKVLLFFNRYEIPQIENFYVNRNDFQPVFRLSFLTFSFLTPLMFLGISAMIIERRNRVVMALIIVYVLSMSLFFITARYRVPLVGLAAVTGAIGLHFLFYAIRARQWKRIAVSGAALLAGTIVSYPLPFDMNYTFSQFYNQTGFRFRQLSDYDRATFFYQKAVAFDPSYATALRNLADVRTMTGDDDSAERLYKGVIDIDASDSVAWFNLGYLYHRQGRLTSAAEAYQNAMKTDPTFSMAYNNLAMILSVSGERSRAISLLQKALETDSTNHQAFNNLGQMLYALGLFSDASALFQAAIDLRPDEFRYQLNLVSSLIQEKKFDAALILVDSVYESVRGTYDLELSALRTMMKLHAQRGDYQEIVGEVTMFMEQYPECSEIRDLHEELE